jgi:hypothetical protein
MTLAAGTAQAGTWRATLDAAADGLHTNGTLRYYVVVRSTGGATARTPAGSTSSLAVNVCANTGPTITPVSITPTKIVTDPLGVGCGGSTLTTFRVRAKDTDGVTSLTLYFRKPGDASYTRRPMTLDAGDWYSFINTVASVDDITDAGTMPFYIVARDTKGATSRYPSSGTRSISVTRCDSPASLVDGAVSASTVSISAKDGLPNSVTIQVYGTDPDGVASMTLNWTVRNAAGSIVIHGNAHMSPPVPGTPAWYATLKATKAWSDGATLTWHATLVDSQGNSYHSAEYGTVKVIS